MRFGKPLLMGVVPCSAIFAIAMVGWNWLSLPKPAEADRNGLIKWLVLRELAAQDYETQLALLDRMQIEFGSGPNLDAAQSGLSASLQARLDRNLAFLQRFWFYTRVEQLAVMEQQSKAAFLDAQIDFAERWGELTPSTSGQPDVFDMIDDWIAQAAGERKRVVQNGVREALRRFLRTRRLDRYPAETRLELANRIVEDLELGMSLSGAVAGDLEEAKNLRENGLMLIEAWLTEQAKQYADLSLEQRKAYLDKRIQQIRDWGVLQLFAKEEGGSAIAAMMAFSAKSQQWIARADEANRAALQLLFRDVTQRLLFGGA